MSAPELIVVAARLLGAPGSAVAVQDGRISGVGDARALLRERGPRTRVVTAPNGLLCAGFHDAHVHVVLAAASRTEVDLHGLDGPAVVDAVRAAAAARPPGRWVIGRGFDPAQFPGVATARTLLDAAAPDHPVLVRSHDYHSAALNTPALEIAGVRHDTPDQPGGRIERDAHGEPDGVLREAAAMRAEARAGDLTDDELAKETEAVLRELARAGLTALHDMSGSRYDPVLRLLASADRLTLPLITTVSPGEAPWCGGGPRLRCGGVKIFLDGALGTRTALLLTPYEGESAHRGIAVTTPDAARERVLAAAARGLPSYLHAIGDAAVRTALDVTEGVGAPDGSPLRHRVEHAQMVHGDDIARFGAAGIVASVQPVHIAEDATLAHEHWGARSNEAFPLRRLLDAGAPLAFGSDAPIETPDVLDGVRCAVTRTGRDGTELHPEEALTVEEALRAYTSGAAWAAGLENECGALRPGLRASLTLLNRDILTHREALDDCAVAATVVDGDVLHEIDS